MCGILGIVDFSKKIDIAQSEFNSILNLLEHRGPDASGVYVNDNFLFGHTRLSIIDTCESANQPMDDLDHQITITFNGEIYNFQEIKNELINNGVIFRTKSDTEVLLEAYKLWGINLVNKLNGIYAFAIFDRIKNSFYLVRDRAGVKPVYYTMFDNKLIFSSEIKGIINMPGFNKKINLQAISSFLSFRQPIGNETLFKGIYILQPGFYIEFKDGHIKQTQYWKLSASKKSLFLSKNKKNEIKDLIRDSIKLTLVGDIKPAAFLSGGLDSSIILSEMRHLTTDSIDTFTVAFDEESYDEYFYAKIMADKCNANNIKIPISAIDYMQNIKKLIRYKDQPLAMHNEVALYLMSKVVKTYTKVALSGEGSDELFGGYGKIFKLYFDINRMKSIKILPKFLQKRIIKYLNINEKFLNLSSTEYFLAKYEYFPRIEKFEIFNESVKAQLNSDEFIDRFINDEFQQCSSLSYKDKILYFFQKFHLHGLLTMMDTASMAAGLEVRFPFTDHRLIEAINKIPFRYKIKWKTLFHYLKSFFMPINSFSEKNDITKYLLKDLYSNELPPQITAREKMVFPVPLKEWFGGEFSSFVKKEVLSADSKSSIIFDKEKLRSWINNKEKSDDELYGRKIWLILNIEYWLREYFPDLQMETL